MGSGRSITRRRGGAAAIAAALVALTVAVFLPAGGHGFLLFDDDVHVTENPWIRPGLTAAGVRWAFTSLGYGANWYPLTWVSHMLDAELYGLGPRGHHLTSVALHALATALLFFALRRLTGTLWRSALAAAFFAVHPLRVESVAWVAERKDVLSGCFWNLTLLLYAGYARAPRAGRYLGVLLALAAGLLSKPTTVSLPFVLLLLDWWPLGRLGAAPLGEPRPAGTLSPRRAIAEKLPLLALSAMAMAATFLAQRAAGALVTIEPYPLWLRAANACWSCLAYLNKTVWPADLAIFYPHPGFGLSPWQGVAAAGVLATVTGVAFFLRRRLPFLLTGWAWYLGTLVPVLGFVQVGAQGLADRYTYLPLVGIFLIVTAALPSAPAATRRFAGVGAAAAVVACALVSRSQLGHWRDNSTVFGHALEVTTGNWMAHNFVGISLLEDGHPAAAESHFAEAIAIRPHYWRAQYNLGNSLLAQGRLDAAAEAYRQAIGLNPAAAAAYNNLGAALLRLGKTGEARARFEQALRLQPGFADARRNLSLAMGAPTDQPLPGASRRPSPPPAARR